MTREEIKVIVNKLDNIWANKFIDSTDILTIKEVDDMMWEIKAYFKKMYDGNANGDINDIT
jgi:hypothetical protein